MAIASGHAARHNPPGSDDPAIASYGSPATPKLYAALAKAQSEFPPIAFDSTAELGPGRKYRYASLNAILTAVRPVLNKHGIFLWQGMETFDGTYQVTTSLCLQDEILQHHGPRLEISKGGPHELGSAETYLRRYGLSSMLAIAAGEDEDGHAAQQATAERGKDSPRTSRRKAATSEQPPASSATGASSTGEPGAEGEPLIGTLCEIEEGTTAKGAPYWKFTLFHKDREPVRFGTFEPQLGAVLADGEQVEVRWKWSRDGKYRNAVGIDVLPF